MLARVKALCALWLALWTGAAGAGQVPAGNVTFFPEAEKSRPQAIVAAPDGAIWYATSTRICRMTMDGKHVDFSLPDNLTTNVRGTVVQSLVYGPDGSLWGAYNQGNAIWRMTPKGEFTAFAIPTPKAWPRDMAVGPDGNIWFTELEANKIAKITTKGQFTEYAIPTANAHPYGMTAGPDGQIWFTEYYVQKIGKVSMTGEFTSGISNAPARRRRSRRPALHRQRKRRQSLVHGMESQQDRTHHAHGRHHRI